MEFQIQRLSSLERAHPVFCQMMRFFLNAGIQFEDRSGRGNHNFLAEPGGSRTWHLSVHIDFGSSDEQDVIAAATLRRGEQIVYEMRYSGAQDCYFLDGEVTPDDHESWNANLPYRQELTRDDFTLLRPDVIRHERDRLLQAMAEFYQNRRSVIPRRFTSMPPPPSSEGLPLPLSCSGFLFEFGLYFISNMPVRRSLEDLFRLVVAQEASDLHMIVGLPPMLRVHKELIPVADAEPVAANSLANDIRGVLSPELHERYLKNLSVDASYTLSDGTRFRLNVYFEKGNPALAARCIPSHIPALADLQVPAAVHEFIQLGQGIVLVTGPTGSGKSTLLASMLEEINQTRKEHIITFEDPIEFLFTPKQSIISQLQLGRDFPSFQEALKHALRQDPNIILIGEMRDLETMQAALTLAETGHLVFATLHTNSAPQTIERVVNAFPPYQQTQVRLQLALSLRGVVSQLLLTAPTGGLVAAREVMVNNSAIAHLIIEAKTEQIPNVLMTSGDLGMHTMDQELMEMVNQGTILPEVAMKHSRHPEKFGGEAIEE